MMYSKILWITKRSNYNLTSLSLIGGKAKARLETACFNRELERMNVEQERINFGATDHPESKTI